MRIDQWASSSQTHRCRFGTRTHQSWRPTAACSTEHLHFEQLEERTLLSIGSAVDYSAVSPAWFGTAAADDFGSALIGPSPLTGMPELGNDADGEADGSRWIVRMTSESLSRINSVDETPRLFDASEVSF